MTARPTERRPLGRSGVDVTTLGFGAAAIAGLYEPVADATARQSVDRAWALGTRFFDTAPHYGHGLSERRLGQALAHRPRDEFVLSTKVGRLLRPGAADSLFRGALPLHSVHDFSASAIRTSLEASLERLGVDRVDVVHLHDPDNHADQALDESYPVLDDLRRQGVIRALGAGMNQTAVLTRFAREADFDCFLVAGRYTLLDQSALDDLLPACAARGIGVVIGGVYNSGVLARPEPTATFDYAPVPTPLLQRVRRLRSVCASHRVPLMAAAIQFPLGHPAVTSVLSGARSPLEVEENDRMMRVPVPAALWNDLKEAGLLRADAPVPRPHLHEVQR